jgi:hypothetical protein
MSAEPQPTFSIETFWTPSMSRAGVVGEDHLYVPERRVVAVPGSVEVGLEDGRRHSCSFVG